VLKRQEYGACQASYGQFKNRLEFYLEDSKCQHLFKIVDKNRRAIQLKQSHM